MKWKFAFWIKQNCSSLTTFIFHLSPAVSKKNTHLSYVFVETKVPCCTHWRGKQKYQVTRIGMKSTIVTFAAMTSITVLTNGNYKLFLGLERKHKHETYTLLRLCLIKFLSAHILLILVDYQGRERHEWGPMWLLYQSCKLHSALSEIVSLVFQFYGHISFS